VKLSRFLGAVMGTAARRPLAVGLAVGLLAVAGGLLALRLTPTAATDTLVGKGTPSYQATQRFHDASATTRSTSSSASRSRSSR
jgi:hypothetical protein